jgi:hypothetical protein
MLWTTSFPIYQRILVKHANDVAEAIEWILSLHMLSRPLPRPRPGEFKYKFTTTEDAYLRDVVERFGTNDWILVANQMPLRNPRQCRERWTNYLCPTIANDDWTAEEDELLEQKFAELGTKWKVITEFFPARSTNNIKYRWLRREKIKARVEAAQGRTTLVSRDSASLTQERDTRVDPMWGGISFEKGPDSALWDEFADCFF